MKVGQCEMDALQSSQFFVAPRTWEDWKAQEAVLHWRDEKPTLPQAIRLAKTRPEMRMLSTIYLAGLKDPKAAEQWLKLVLPQRYSHALRVAHSGKIDHEHNHKLQKEIEKAISEANPIEVRRAFLQIANGNGESDAN